MVSERRRVQNNENAKRWTRNHPEKHSAMVKKWEQENPERHREIRKQANNKHRAKLRQRAIAAMGGVCIRCQCDDIRCLQIDHIIPIKGERVVYTKFYYSIIQGDTTNLQLLCANCHAIKTYENGDSR